MKLPVYLIDIGAILYPEDKAYEKYNKNYDGQFGYQSYDKGYECSLRMAKKVANTFVEKYSQSYAVIKRTELDSKYFESKKSKEYVNLTRLRKIKIKLATLSNKDVVYSIANLSCGNSPRKTIVEDFMETDEVEGL